MGPGRNPEDQFSHNEAHIKVGFKVVYITQTCKHDVSESFYEVHCTVIILKFRKDGSGQTADSDQTTPRGAV